MKIAVCIKQVPGTAQVEIDQETGVLKRDGIASKMNPYDLYAIETAMRIKSVTGAEITAVTMGPPQSENVLQESFMMGVDHAVLISDRKFAGSDVLATSYALSQGLKCTGEFDIIVCGKQTTDGDTAQVSAELAEFLNIPHIANVCRIHKINNDSLVADVDMPLQVLTVRISFPCLIAVDKNIFEPRLPSFKLKIASSERKITLLTIDNMEDKNEKHYGLNGSPTRVKRIFPPESHNVREIWNDDNAAEKLFERLNNKRFLQQL